MDFVFIKLLNMSLTASWLVLAVIILRFILKKAPKWIMGVLWGFVAIRLICPFSLESVFSLVPSAEPIPQDIIVSENPTINSGLPLMNQTINPIISKSLAPNVESSVNPMQIITFVASVIWIVGIIAMLLYTLISYIRICRKVREVVPLKGNIWVCDHISTPFILGIIRPKIYLPSSMNRADMKYVISHEQAHLKRKDHIWKPLGFLLLSVYWFNPLLWVAYILLCKDIELACDERVIRQLGSENKKPYSDALINCSVPRKMISACPLAFGETGIKERVKGVLSYKKPAFWVIFVAFAACIITAVCLLTNPTGIRITQLNEGPEFSNLFNNIENVTVISDENNYSTNDSETIDKIILFLQEVEIKNHPISQSRAEDRDMTNRVILNKGNTLCFSKNYSELWIYTGVKPTFSYKVLNPSKVKNIFEIKPAERITSSFSVVDKGSDIEGVSLSVKWVELNAEKPYIQIEWKNDAKNEVTYPESFDILYYDNGKLVTCTDDSLYFNSVANIIPPNDYSIKDYDISLFDLSKDGRYRLQVEHNSGEYSWVDFEINSASEAKLGGVDEPNEIIINPS